MRLGPEGLFLVGRAEGLTLPVFHDLIERLQPFVLKVDYRGLPPPVEELDLVRLIPAKRSELPCGTLVLRCGADGFEFLRISSSGHASTDGDENVARVVEVERPGVRIRLDSRRWRLLGSLLVGIPGFLQAYEWWYRLSSFVMKLLHPFPCPVSLGPPEALVRGVIEKYSHPGEVKQQIKLSDRGLEEWEEDLISRVVPPGSRVLIVGCGAGREAVPLAKQGFRVVGIDPVPGLTEAARRHAQAHGVEATFEVKAAADLDGPPESFDAILCSCYEHIPTRRRRIEMLRLLRSLVRPQGIIILTAGWNPTRGIRLALVDGLRWLLRKLLGERFTTEPGDRLIRHLSLASDAQIPCFYHAFQGPEEIQREIEAAGLTGEMDPEGPWIIRPENSRKQQTPLSREERLLLLCSRLRLDDGTRQEVEGIASDGVDWDVILGRSWAEGIHALLYTHLRELERVTPCVPQSILARLEAGYQANWARNIVLTERWAELMALLAGEGVDVITHKGMALIHTVYPDIALRPMADIDLLIRPGDLPTVKRTLRAAGYRTPGESMEAEEAFRGYLHFVRDSTVIDLHWEPAHYSRFEGIVRVDHDGLWRRARRLAVGEAQGLMLSPEDLLLHLALHVTLGSEFGRLIWFADLDAVLSKFGPALDWERVLEEAARWRVKVLLGFTLRICQESLGTPIPPGVLPRLLPGRSRLALLNACIGTTCPPSLSDRVSESRIYLGEALMMDRLRHVFRVLAWSLFPPRAWVKFHYGSTSPWRISLHRAFHPFRVFYLAVKHLR